MGRGDGESRRKIPEGMTFERWHSHDGWALRRYHHLPTTVTRGSLLFLGGRGDFVEKYLEALDHWHRNGWRIDGFDWRGQGGSGRMLADPLICHLDSFDPLLDDLENFVSEWRATAPPPHVAIAHSMGGHLLLRLLAERGAVLDGAVLLAPMSGIAARPLPAPAVRLLAATAVAAGLRHRRLWRGDAGNVGGRITSCPDRHSDKIWWKATKPEIASGAPSWGWLRAALASIRQLESAQGLTAIGTPLLILAAERDRVIDLAALRRLAARLPGAALEILPGGGHELLREADRYRLPVIERIDCFLERAVRTLSATQAPMATRTVRR